jgi:hypothetical protein
MYIESAAQSRQTATSVGSDDLAQALMLLRASTLKIIRLQLAIERRDRQVALTSLDDLIMLDRRLQDYLGGIAGPGEQLMFQGQLDAERAALSKEKLTLAAGILRRPNISVDPQPVANADLARSGNEDWLETGSLQPEAEEPRRGRLWLAVIPILLSAVGAAAYLAKVPDAAGLIASAVGALK